MLIIEEIENKLFTCLEKIDYIMLSPTSRKVLDPKLHSWYNSELQKVHGIKIIWNIENKDDEIIFLKKV